MGQVLRGNTKQQFTARGKFSVTSEWLRHSGKAVCYARVIQASCEKSRHIFASRFTPLQKSVTPFALGRLKYFDPCGAMVNLTSCHVLALISRGLSPCGAQRCRAHSYRLCSPSSSGLPPQPRTPGRAHLPALNEARWMESEYPASALHPTRSTHTHNAFRLFIRSGGTG